MIFKIIVLLFLAYQITKYNYNYIYSLKKFLITILIMVKYNIENEIKNAKGKEKKKLLKIKKEEVDWIQSIDQMLINAGIVISTPGMSWYVLV